jgi:hypothetical protein
VTQPAVDGPEQLHCPPGGWGVGSSRAGAARWRRGKRSNAQASRRDGAAPSPPDEASARRQWAEQAQAGRRDGPIKSRRDGAGVRSSDGGSGLDA